MSITTIDKQWPGFATDIVKVMKSWSKSFGVKMAHIARMCKYPHTSEMVRVAKVMTR